MTRWQNVCDYREYIGRVFQDQSPIGLTENLTSEMKRAERVALSLRTRDGVPATLLQDRPGSRGALKEFFALGLIEPSNGNFVLTRAGKALADSVAEAFV
jgi:coproporphyrinogen III oxidase-like Fe-S oxidoreductase